MEPITFTMSLPAMIFSIGMVMTMITLALTLIFKRSWFNRFAVYACVTGGLLSVAGFSIGMGIDCAKTINEKMEKQEEQQRNIIAGMPDPFKSLHAVLQAATTDHEYEDMVIVRTTINELSDKNIISLEEYQAFCETIEKDSVKQMVKMNLVKFVDLKSYIESENGTDGIDGYRVVLSRSRREYKDQEYITKTMFGVGRTEKAKESVTLVQHSVKGN